MKRKEAAVERVGGLLAGDAIVGCGNQENEQKYLSKYSSTTVFLVS